MKKGKIIRTDAKWKERLEEWTPDVEVAGWEDVANRIPSGRAFRVRQLVEGSAAKVGRIAARLISSKLALLVIPAAVVTGYVAYKIESSKPTPTVVQRMDAGAPASTAAIEELPASVGPYDTKRDTPEGGEADPSLTVQRLQPTGSSATAGGMGVPASVLQGGASDAFTHHVRGLFSDGISIGTNAASSGGAKDPASSDIKLVSSGDFTITPASVGEAEDSRKATLTHRNGTGASGKAFVARHVKHSHGASFTSWRASTIRNRGKLGSRSIGSARVRSKRSHRSLYSATNSKRLIVVRPDLPDQSEKKNIVKRRAESKPISRIAIKSSAFRLQPSKFTDSPIRFEVVPPHWFDLRYFSIFGGAAFEAGVASSHSSTFALAGINAFTGVMYRGRVGLLVIAGGRWVGGYYPLVRIDSTKKVDIPGTDPDSVYARTTSTLLRGYFQATFGADAVVRLYANPNMSLYATAGMRGCWMKRVTGDSTSRTFLPLSAMRLSAAYRRSTSFGSLIIGAAVEYQVKQARPLSKSAILFGVNVGVVF